jgi:CRP-like cAMP-binding protein
MSENHIDIPLLLARIPLFQQLSAVQQEEIAQGCREKRLAKGEMLFQKGDPSRGFFVVVFGQIKLAFPSAQGAEKVVSIRGANQSFGEAVMFMNHPYPVFAEALTDSLVLHIASNPVFEMIAHDSSFARLMLAGLSMRLHSLVADIETYSLRSSTQRVIGFLLQLCPQHDTATNIMEVTLPTSKHVIASRLNLTPETLSRIFHELSANGLIGVKNKQITINSVDQLRAYDQNDGSA